MQKKMKRLFYLLLVLAFVLDGSVQDAFGMTCVSPVSQQPQDPAVTEVQTASAPKKRVRKKKRRRNRKKVTSTAQRTKALEEAFAEASSTSMSLIGGAASTIVEEEKPVVAPVETEPFKEVPVEETAVREVPVKETAVKTKAAVERKREMSFEQNLSTVKTTPVVNAKSKEAPASKEKSADGLPVIAFAAGSNAVAQNQMDKMAELATYLRNHPRVKVGIKGKPVRTKAVRNALISRYGINSDRLVEEKDGNAASVTFVVK